MKKKEFFLGPEIDKIKKMHLFLLKEQRCHLNTAFMGSITA